MPVAAVADIVVVSAAFAKTAANVLVDPLNVAVALNVEAPLIVVVLDADNVVNAPVLGVVAPTEPFKAPAKPVAVNMPVLGLNWYLVELTYSVVTVPVVTVVNNG